MTWVLQQPQISLILIFCAFVTTIFGWTRWKLRGFRPTAGPGALLLWCGAWWMLTDALMMASTSVSMALFWQKLAYVAIAPLPIVWLYLALQFTGRDQSLTRPRMVLLCVIPVTGLLLALAASPPDIFAADTRVELMDSGFQVLITPGPAMALFYSYGYVLLGVGTYLLIQRLTRNKGFRWQGSVLLACVVTVFAANLLDYTGHSPIPSISLTPLLLATTVPVFVVTLYRARRADLVPFAQTEVLRNVEDAILVLDIEDRIVDLNRTAEQVLGHDRCAVRGVPIGQVWPAWTTLLSAGQLGPGLGNEIRIGDDDHERVLEARHSTLADWRGVPLGQVVVLRDITERVRAEEALRSSEEYYRALIENASELTFVFERTGDIRYASPSADRFTGLTQSAARSCADIVHPDDVERLLSVSIESLSNPITPGHILVRFRNASGSWSILECAASNLLGHPPVDGIVVNARDVTEREAIAHALQSSEEKYRLEFEYVTDVVFTHDIDGIFNSISASLQRNLGHAPEELLGKSVLDMVELNIIAPEDVGRVQAALNRVLNGEKVDGLIVQLVAANGTRKHAEITSGPIYRNGEIVGAVSVGRDVTERECAEEQLRASLMEKEVLLKEIHHRVKNSLQIVSSLLSLHAQYFDDPEVREQLAESQTRIQAMALVHELLYRSSDLKRVSFKDYVVKLVEFLNRTFQPEGERIKFMFDLLDCDVDIDTATPCGLCLNELVSNALRHAFPDGRRGEVLIEAKPVGDGRVRLSVQDNGIGLPADLDLATSSTLGLKLVRSLATQLGSELEVSTSSGAGFAIRFQSLNVAAAVSPHAKGLVNG